MSKLPFNPTEISAYYRERAPKVAQTGSEWRGPCPIHDGDDDNFTVNPNTGMAYCHSQCGKGWSLMQFENAVSGKSWKECRRDINAIVGRQNHEPAKWREVAHYDYTDAEGQMLFQVVRFEPKTFRQRRRVVKMDGASAGITWEYNVKGVHRVLYRLPKVISADQVLLVEGEKDVENLEKLGFTASCNPGGACSNSGKWLKNYTDSLEGKSVVILPDNDEPGTQHAQIVFQALRFRARELRIVKIPVGKDASDWIAAGATREIIEQAIAETPVTGGQVSDVSGNIPSDSGCAEAHSPGSPAPRTAGRPAIPQVQVTDRPFRTICDETLDALQAANIPPRLFKRTCRIVGIDTSELGRPFINELSDARLRHHLSRAADFFEVNSQGIRRDVPPPMDVTRDIRFQDPVNWRLPVLDAVIEAPTIRTDGTVLAQPGYDPQSQLYLIPGAGLQDLDIPKVPTRDHLDVSVEMIRTVFTDFPFVDQASQTNVIAALLTAFCRHIIRGPVPLALFDATSQGTGKTLLAEVIALILTGRPAELITPMEEPEELRKQLTSMLMESPPLVIIDNVTSTVDWPALAKVITGDVHRDRVLGKSQSVVMPVKCSWIATGNNLQLGGDIARRCFWIRMDAGMPEPFRRSGFQHPRLKEHVLAERRNLLIALLTLVRAWFAAGQPRTSVPPVGSFEHWTEVVGGILEYAGVEGFLGNSGKMFENSDGERGEWEAFLETLEDAFEERPFTVAQLWERLNEQTYEEIIRRSVLSAQADQLREAVPMDLSRWMDREGVFKQRLGIAFKQRCSQRFGKRQLAIERAEPDTGRNVQRWRVVPNA